MPAVDIQAVGLTGTTAKLHYALDRVSGLDVLDEAFSEIFSNHSFFHKVFVSRPDFTK